MPVAKLDHVFIIEDYYSFDTFNQQEVDPFLGESCIEQEEFTVKYYSGWNRYNRIEPYPPEEKNQKGEEGAIK